MMNVTAVKGISLKLVSAFFFQKPTSFCVVRQPKKKTDSRPRGKSVFFNRIHMEKPNLKNALNTNMAMKMKNAPHYSKCDNFEKKIHKKCGQAPAELVTPVVLVDNKFKKKNTNPKYFCDVCRFKLSFLLCFLNVF